MPWGVFERVGDFEVPEVAPPVSLHHVQRIAVRLAGGIEPGFVVHPDAIDYERKSPLSHFAIESPV